MYVVVVVVKHGHFFMFFFLKTERIRMDWMEFLEMVVLFDLMTKKSVTFRIKIPLNKLIDNLWVPIESRPGFMD